MCRELSFLVSPNRAVSLSCVFTSPPLTNITKKTGFPPGLCLYHCKLFEVLEKLQYVVKFSPSCRSRNWGICFICCPFTSVQKKTIEGFRESLVRSLFSELQWSLSSFSIFLILFSFPNPSYLPSFLCFCFVLQIFCSQSENLIPANACRYSSTMLNSLEAIREISNSRDMCIHKINTGTMSSIFLFFLFRKNCQIWLLLRGFPLNY